MKARIRGDKHQGDENIHHRLLSYLRTGFPGRIDQLDMIRPSVFFLKSAIGEYIVKGYTSYHRLKLQEAFTATLKKEGFTHTYSYVCPGRRKPYYLDGLYWGILEYIQPHPNPFTFLREADRFAGLKLLQKYHSITQQIVQRYKTILPPAALIDKWENRLELFKANKPMINYFVNRQATESIISWAEFALRGMKEQQAFFTEGTQVILHGDVAHHNFLRSKNGKVYLIDFDLISIGPPVLDYLQYSNRILPFLHWSLEELAKYNNLAAFMSVKAFLYALAYPADLLREWNRIFKNSASPNQHLLYQIIELTMGQFKERQQFFKKIQDELNSV
ncbi:phosphotransferase [Neobacillus notoginsengisoli]|nr:phosphotransferase [Neobacillus notoginsengisoli]